MTRPDITLPRATVEQVVSELIAGTGSIDHINNLLTELTDALQAQPTPVAQPETTDVTFGATLFAFVRMSLAYPTEAQLHQLDRLIAFYGDQKFASQLKLLAHQARTPHVNRDVGRARSLVFSGSEGIGRKESEIQAAPHNHEDLKQLAEGALREHDGTDEGFHNWRAANRAFRRKTHPASILSLLSELNTRQAALQAQPTSKPAIAWPEPKCLTCGCHSIDIAGNCDYCGAPYKAQPTPPVGQAAAEPVSDLRGIDAGPLSEWVDLIRRGYMKKDECLIAVKDIPKWVGQNTPPATQAAAEPVIPADFALVPIRATAAMEEVFAEEGWEWANVLAAAEAVTEGEYEEALEATPPTTQAAPVSLQAAHDAVTIDTLNDRVMRQQAALTAALDYLWVVVEHNRLHFGDSHNTVIQGQAVVAQIEALKGPTP